LNRARSYVEQHSLGSVKLPDVAAAIGISPSRVAHLFRDKIGTTFSAWLAVQPISKAITILRKQDLPIAEVAELTGFCSYRSFYWAFKKVAGQTPASYKKLVRNF
jgi:AraC-like DNA-binding protein